MSYLVFKRLVEFFGEPGMTWEDFKKILERLKNANK